MTAVMIGVVALKMLARPEVTCCCAHENSRNGTTQNDTREHRHVPPDPEAAGQRLAAHARRTARA